MTTAAFRKAALALPEAVESSHMGHPDFRVGGKIFATLGYPDDAFGVVMLPPEDQAYFVNAHGASFAPAKGGWGKGGSTVVTLAKAETRVVRAALEVAWRRRAPKRLWDDRP